MPSQDETKKILADNPRDIIMYLKFSVGVALNRRALVETLYQLHEKMKGGDIHTIVLTHDW